MRKKRFLIIVSLILAIAFIYGLIYKMNLILQGVNSVTDYEAESLRWSIIGAIGGWAGSIFGAIALVISILAFLLPQKVKIKVEVSAGCMLSLMPDPECKPHPGRMEDSGEIIKSLQARYMTPTGNFEQKNRARSLDKALTKAFLLFPSVYILGDWEPVVNN